MAADQLKDFDTSSSYSWHSANNRPLGSDSSLASKASSTQRTPLSSQSKPFVSRHVLSSKAKPFETTPTPVVKWVPLVVGWSAPQDYSEEAQEDIYLALQGAAETLAPEPYSETLQEDVYLPTRGRQCWRDARCISRTPSPTSADAILAELAGPVSKAPDSEQLPVKHTFIHYARSDSGDDVQNARIHGMRKSASSPSVLFEDSFQILPVLSQAELHLLGKCSPCAYLHKKKDGCRWGADCAFCHECSKDQIKIRKKIKTKACRERKMRLEKELASKVVDEGTVRPGPTWCDLEDPCFEYM